jgi:hypothetical protein
MRRTAISGSGVPAANCCHHAARRGSGTSLKIGRETFI